VKENERYRDVFRKIKGESETTADLCQ